MLQRIVGFGASVRDLALPPRCPGCGAITTGAHRFCARCWGSLEFLGPPWCAGCNRPFEHDRGPGARCAPCLDDPPIHAGVRAVVRYGDVARALALRLKYGGRTGDAVTAARLMRRHVPEDAALLVPVPLHPRRLWQRGYNQAALIAAALSRETNVRADLRLLSRTRPTPVLRGLTRPQRRKAVAGAFKACETDLSGTVVLVDDVYTTGSTAEACSAALLNAGAGRVVVLAWARVLRDEETAAETPWAD